VHAYATSERKKAGEREEEEEARRQVGLYVSRLCTRKVMRKTNAENTTNVTLGSLGRKTSIARDRLPKLNRKPTTKRAEDSD
jgi:hypothetical protein